MADDVVARLRNWVTDWNGAVMVRGEPPRDGIHCDVIYDAIDEIERLRGSPDGYETYPSVLECKALVDKARNEALEEAEIACLTEARDYVISLGQDNYRDGCRNCASTIRALKDKGDE